MLKADCWNEKVSLLRCYTGSKHFSPNPVNCKRRLAGT